MDGAVGLDDLSRWVEDVLNSYVGDANLDGEFNSTDFVTVFQGGKYESGSKASWSEGDWDADGVFTSADLIAAFQSGGYEQGPKGAVSAVPEPNGLFWLFVGLTGFIFYRRYESNWSGRVKHQVA